MLGQATKKILSGKKLSKRDQVKQEIAALMKRAKYDTYIRQGLSKEDAEYRSRF